MILTPACSSARGQLVAAYRPRCAGLSRRIILSVLLFAGGSAASAAPLPVYSIPYTLTDLGLLPGGVSSTATAIDGAGEVAGYTTFSDGTTEAFYWTPVGGMVGLGGTNSKAYGVSSGAVVGIDNGDAFKWTSGTGIVHLDGTNRGQVNGINASGAAVGNRITGSQDRVILWSPTNVISNPFPVTNRTGTAINDNGEFVGVLTGGSGYYSDGTAATTISIIPDALSNNRLAAGATVINGGTSAYENINTLTTTPIGTLSGDSTSKALGIDPAGTTIVGVSNGHGGFVYDIATANLQSLTGLLDSSDTGWSITSAAAINNAGTIAATALAPDGTQHAVLLTVPEPGTVALAILGACGLMILRYGGRTQGQGAYQLGR